jgi:hypothetical protein
MRFTKEQLREAKRNSFVEGRTHRGFFRYLLTILISFAAGVVYNARAKTYVDPAVSRACHWVIEKIGNQ